MSVGVGEEVQLTYKDGKGDGASWSTTSGSLSSTSGASVKWTAPDASGEVTITAQGPSCTATITFSVIQPSTVKSQQYPGAGIWHYYNTATIGYGLIYYIGPDSVNFYNIQVKEIAVSSPTDATGVFSHFSSQPLGAGPATGMTPAVTPGLGTKINFSDAPYYDTVWSGSSIGAPPFAPGVLIYDIPWEYKVGSGSWKSLANVPQLIVLDDDGVTLKVNKGGTLGTCLVSSPTNPLP